MSTEDLDLRGLSRIANAQEGEALAEETGFAFTVFTPTHDRASWLPGVRASLEAQTYRDFEWLVVDDGSRDGTRELVAGWIETSSMPIRYIYQEHAGMHVAYNRAVSEARGTMFVKLDSDDECVPEALARLWQHWHAIPASEREAFKGVTVLCKDEHGALVGEPFPSDPFDTDSLELYFSSVSDGEKWGCQLTDILRRFPFPEPAGVTFVPETVVWFEMARHYRIRCVNEVLRMARQVQSGPRLSRLTSTTARGRLLHHQAVLNDYLDFFPRAPLVVLKCGINYCRYSFYVGRSPLRQLSSLRRTGKLVALACLAPGALACARDRIRERRAVRELRPT